MKKITIIDCYISSERVLSKLESMLNMLKNNGEDVLLMSNTTTSNSSNLKSTLPLLLGAQIYKGDLKKEEGNQRINKNQKTHTKV